MITGMSYGDAVALLGGRGRVAQAIDKLTGGLLLAAVPVGGSFVLSLFDAKGDLASLGGDLVAAGLERARGLPRYERTQRLAAAHAVIVLSSFFEAVSRADLPFQVKDLRLADHDRRVLTGTDSQEHLVEVLLRRDLPLPSPERPREQVRQAVAAVYHQFADRLATFITGLAVVDQLDSTRQSAIRETLLNAVPESALSLYQNNFRRLAADEPEVGLWVSDVDHEATRRSLRYGLTRLESVLAPRDSIRTPDDRRRDLAALHRAELDQPILAAGEAPDGVVFPTLGRGYVDPDFRAAPVGSLDDLVSEEWWAQQECRSGLERFLMGHLTGVNAARVPLLVLGQPGAGKSLLTKILAARLPPSDWMVVRVTLRDVPADGDVESHVEHGIRSAIGGSTDWPLLSGSSGDALPLVLLDGFDELLQATGVNQTDYLDRVSRFQQREAALGRPLAVIVTSRMAVADRARCPAGTVAVRLEPFGPEQVELWVERWNSTNDTNFADRGLEPLALDAVLAQPELASQPLLLLMLALYDCDGNALSGVAAGLGRAELYERLLYLFAEREVRKSSAALAADAFRAEVEAELLRLSVVAFAMFNRGRQWVGEQEADDDLRILLGTGASPGRPDGDLGTAPLSAGERQLGRFFFIHQGEARREGQNLRAFEFLHATFGEYLLGRLVAHELLDLADEIRRQRRRARPAELDESFLRAILSFAALTGRAAAVTFLQEHIAAWPEADRAVLREPLLDFFGRSHDAFPADRYSAYDPAPAPVPLRHAAYSVNLLVLLLMVNEEVRTSELFGDPQTTVWEWRDHCLLWRSHLGEGWDGLLAAIDVERTGRTDDRDVLIRLGRRGPVGPIDPVWMFAELGGLYPGPSSWRYYEQEEVRTHTYVIMDRRSDVNGHLAEPFHAFMPSANVWWFVTKAGSSRSLANSLLNLWLASSTEAEPELLQRIYDECLEVTEFPVSHFDEPVWDQYRDIVVRQLKIDAARLDSNWLAHAAAQFDIPQEDLPGLLDD